MVDLPKFEYWVQRVLPQVYDESMSYYELLIQVKAHLNDVIASQNETNANFVELNALFVTLNSYVDDYFTNLDVQAEIDVKLNAMVADGTMNTIINETIFNDLTAQLAETVKNVNYKGIYDTEDIQTSLNELTGLGGGTLFLNKGVYHINEPINIPSNITITGTKESVVHIHSETGFYGSGVENISFLNFTVKKDKGGGKAFSFRGFCNNLYFDKLILQGIEVYSYPDYTNSYTEGISIRESNNIVIQNCLFKDFSGHSIVVGTNTTNAVGECDGVLIDNNEFINFGVNNHVGLGMDISGGWVGSKSSTIYHVRNATITNNRLIGGNNAALKIQVVKNLLFENNTIENVTGRGVYLHAQDLEYSVRVSKNLFKNMDYPILFDGYTLNTNKQKTSITGNTFIDNNISDITVPRFGGFIEIINNIHQSEGATIINVYGAYSDRGLLLVKYNYVEKCLNFITRFATNTVIENNEVNVSSYYVLDRHPEDSIFSTNWGVMPWLNSLIIQNNIFKGSLHVGIYLERNELRGITIRGNDISQGNVDFKTIMFRPSDYHTSINFSSHIVLITNNNFMTKTTVSVIDIETTNERVRYGLIKDNNIRTSALNIYPIEVIEESNNIIVVDGID